MSEQSDSIGVEVPLTPKALRMVKSYGALVGKSVEEVVTDIGEIISEILEVRLKDKIANELGFVEAEKKSGTMPEVTRKQTHGPRFEDTTGISDGLGDDDEQTEPEEIAGVNDPAAFIPKQGGLTDEVLEQDMSVEDPVHEAKVDASTFGDDMLSQAQDTDGTDLFAEVADFVDPRIQKRKKKPGGKGRATLLNHAEVPG